MFGGNLLKKLLCPSLEIGQGIFDAGVGVIKVGFGALILEPPFRNVFAREILRIRIRLPSYKRKPPEVMTRNKVLAPLFRVHGRAPSLL